MATQEQCTSEALGLFIKRFRVLIVSLLDPKDTGGWESEFRKAIYSVSNNEKQEHWIRNISGKEKSELIDCIDFSYLEIFANNRKDLFEPLFGKKEKHHLPTWLSDIVKVRNVLAHFSPAKVKDLDKAWICMEQIAEIINDVELQEGLKSIKNKNNNPNNKFEGSILENKKSNEEIKNDEVLKELKNKTSGIKNYIKIISVVAIIALGTTLILFFKFFSPESPINKKSNNYIYSNTPFDTTKGSYNVLFFPFQRLGDHKNSETGMEMTIITRLLKLNDTDSLNLQIKYDSNYVVRSYSDANLIGKKLKANLVIWGDFYVKDREACLNFANIKVRESSLELQRFGSSKIETINKLSELSEGKLQKETDYIIYWVAASRCYANQNYTKALTFFSKIKNEYSPTFELYLYLGCCFFSLETYKEAKEPFENALAINPNIIEIQQNYACLLLKLNDLFGAKEHFERALRIDPNNAVVHNDYGYLLLKLNDPDGARKHFEKALKIDQNSAEANNNYAFYLEKFDIKGAKEHFEKALKIKPNFAEAHINYAFLLEKLDDLRGAREHYEAALKIRPDYAVAHNNYAVFIKKTNPNKAKEHFEKALKIKPDYAEAFNNYALFLEELGELDNAKEHYEKALTINQDLVEAHYNYANLMEKLNEPNQAREHYEKALSIKPDYSEAHNNYAVLLQCKFNNLKMAKKHYEAALRLKPYNAVNQCNYAFFLDIINESDSAKKHYKKALEIKPDYAEAHNNYAFLLEKLNELSKAKEHYETALKIKPDYPEAYNNYARLLEKLNDLMGAKEQYEKALRIKPDYDIAHNNYACLLIKLNPVKAKEQFENLLEMNPNYGDAHFNYAMLLHDKFNDTKEAKKQYLKAVNIDPRIKSRDKDDYFGVK